MRNFLPTPPMERDRPSRCAFAEDILSWNTRGGNGDRATTGCVRRDTDRYDRVAMARSPFAVLMSDLYLGRS